MTEDVPEEAGAGDDGREKRRAHPVGKAALTAAPFAFLLLLALVQWCP